MDNHIFLICGNNYWPIELDAMWSNYQQLNSSVSTTVFSNRNGTGEYGFDNNVEVENDGMIVNYDKKRETNEANSVNIGYFIVSKESIDPNMKGNVSFEVDILLQFIARQELAA